METIRRLLFATVMFWTVLTTIFAWLPLVRIIGRPEGYSWGLLGVSGAGTDGPYWIFVAATLYVVPLLYSLQRGPRALSYPMLLIWYSAVAGIVALGIIEGGADATLQGQGLHFEFPLWALSVPIALFAAIVLIWVTLDSGHAAKVPAPWSWTNTRRLALSVVLLGAALILFRVGDNYNWVTAAAIVTTVAQWIALARAFEPVESMG